MAVGVTEGDSGLTLVIFVFSPSASKMSLQQPTLKKMQNPILAFSPIQQGGKKMQTPILIWSKLKTILETECNLKSDVPISQQAFAIIHTFLRGSPMELNRAHVFINILYVRYYSAVKYCVVKVEHICIYCKETS